MGEWYVSRWGLGSRQCVVGRDLYGNSGGDREIDIVYERVELGRRGLPRSTDRQSASTTDVYKWQERNLYCTGELDRESNRELDRESSVL